MAELWLGKSVSLDQALFDFRGGAGQAGAFENNALLTIVLLPDFELLVLASFGHQPADMVLAVTLLDLQLVLE